MAYSFCFNRNKHRSNHGRPSGDVMPDIRQVTGLALHDHFHAISDPHGRPRVPWRASPSRAMLLPTPAPVHRRDSLLRGQKASRPSGTPGGPQTTRSASPKALFQSSWYLPRSSNEKSPHPLHGACRTHRNTLNRFRYRIVTPDSTGCCPALPGDSPRAPC